MCIWHDSLCRKFQGMYNNNNSCIIIITEFSKVAEYKINKKIKPIIFQFTINEYMNTEIKMHL